MELKFQKTSLKVVENLQQVLQVFKKELPSESRHLGEPKEPKDKRKMHGPTPPTYIPTEPRWKHWPTYIYDKNYSYGVNFYQPMLEYIDRQGRSSSLPSDYYYYRSHRSELPELPWSDGRALWENRPVEAYSRHELIKRAVNAEDEARDHLSHFKVRDEIGE